MLITVLSLYAVRAGDEGGELLPPKKIACKLLVQKSVAVCTRCRFNFKLCDVFPVAFQVRDNATLVLSRVAHTQQSYDQNHENHEEREYPFN